LPLSCEVAENRSAVLGPPNFYGVETPNILHQFVTVVYCYLVAKFGWVLWSEVHMRSTAMKRNAKFSEDG